ncbi:hypothetical protein B0T24DRAFT_635019 [Lasiosphaeria ovina]|uniref:Uncharacterized protein n=1 Tax=Lasiosphaeria ovina TaxID=92902 RepID=A0AAE0K063_9PEZI|nr:hypothetical protein B0T24DRAFT_635019 [Lasiosphaeria ovina]
MMTGIYKFPRPVPLLFRALPSWQLLVLFAAQLSGQCGIVFRKHSCHGAHWGLFLRTRLALRSFSAHQLLPTLERQLTSAEHPATACPPRKVDDGRPAHRWPWQLQVHSDEAKRPQM